MCLIDFMFNGQLFMLPHSVGQRVDEGQQLVMTPYCTGHKHQIKFFTPFKHM